MQAESPFCPGHPSEGACVFVAREAIYGQMHQFLANAASPRAFMLLGGRQMGKSTLLLRFEEVFPPNMLGVYIPLGTFTSSEESDLLRFVTQQVLHTFAQDQIMFGDFKAEASEKVNRAWFAEKFLPKVFHTIRSRRRLVLLVDDANQLTRIDTAGDHDESLFAFLSRLSARYEQFSLVFALNNEFETNLDRFAPLVEISAIHRISNFSRLETAAFIGAAFQAGENVIEKIHSLTGGDPYLLQWLGQVLVASGGPEPLTEDWLRRATPEVAERIDASLHERWQRLGLNERLVLTAMSNLRYTQPLQPISPEKIERWLVKTDFPLDSTAIKASIRRLEYDLLVYHDAATLSIRSGLLRTWLVNHAQLDDFPPLEEQPAADNRRWWVLLAVLAVAMVLLFLVVQPASRPQPEGAAPPTVTLEQVGP